MTIRGRVRQGVIVLENGPPLPEGAAVTVSYPAASTVSQGSTQRIEVPLVRSAHPGSVKLTGERVAELLDAEDAPA